MTDVHVITLTREQLTSIVDEAVEKALARHAVTPSEVLDSKEAGRLIGRSAKNLERLARAKRIPACRLGKQWRFKRSELQAWALSNPSMKDVG